jgi:hypothetical protein
MPSSTVPSTIASESRLLISGGILAIPRQGDQPVVPKKTHN